MIEKRNSFIKPCIRLGKELAESPEAVMAAWALLFYLCGIKEKILRGENLNEYS